MEKPSRKTLSIMALTVDLALNVRDKDNIQLSYDVPHMEEDILRLGRITDPVHVEHRKADGKDIYIVLRGNRRTLAGQSLMKRPDLPSDVKSALEKVDCVVYTGLTDAERMEMICDQGSQKSLTRSEVVQTVWRLDRQIFDEMQIIQVLYFLLAKFTGNEKKLLECPTEGKARKDFLRSWLHGTVGNYILAAAKMGEYVREQFLLTHKAEDKLLGSNKVEMKCNRERIKLLSAAKSEDVKSQEGWSVEKGGTKFNALIEKFKAEDAGTLERERNSRLSAVELKKKADSFRSAGIRKAFQIAAGEPNDATRTIVDDDERYARIEAVEKLLVQYGTLVKNEEVRKAIGVILHAAPLDVESYLKALSE